MREAVGCLAGPAYMNAIHSSIENNEQFYCRSINWLARKQQEGFQLNSRGTNRSTKVKFKEVITIRICASV